jgi:hypothetical protein
MSDIQQETTRDDQMSIHLEKSFLSTQKTPSVAMFLLYFYKTNESTESIEFHSSVTEKGGRAQ